MQHLAICRRACAMCAIGILLSACTTPAKLSSDQLASLGVRDGAMYWDAEQKLLEKGYTAYVSGAKRENFEFSKTTFGLLICILRIRFKVDDRNTVAGLQVSDPVCLGTP